MAWLRKRINFWPRPLQEVFNSLLLKFHVLTTLLGYAAWSFITWLIFLAYLHARYTLDWKGRRAAILAIIGFIAVLFTYVGVDFLLPQIHGTQ